MKVCHSVDFTPSFSPTPCRLTVSMDMGCAAACTPAWLERSRVCLVPAVELPQPSHSSPCSRGAQGLEEDKKQQLCCFQAWGVAEQCPVPLVLGMLPGPSSPPVQTLWSLSVYLAALLSCPSSPCRAALPWPENLSAIWCH